MLYFFLISLQVFISINLIAKKSILKKIYNYQSIQKTHIGYVPRLGGAIIISFYYLYIFLIDPNSILLNWYIICGSIIIFIIGTLEDIRGSVKPYIRFLALIFSSFIVVFNFEKFPVINVPILEVFFEYRVIEIIIYTIALTALANGVNMIDGMNGLASFSVISILINILILSYIYEIEILNSSIILLLIPLTVFLFFNFPIGKIFLGDTGAYWLGWYSGIIIIIFYGLSDEIRTWSAILICSYPIIEVIFSMLRKVFNNQSPFQADHKHIHTKLFYAISKNDEKKNTYNSLVTISLMPLWFIPISLVAWVNVVPYIGLIAFIIQIVIYLMYYFILPTPPKEKSDLIIQKYNFR